MREILGVMHDPKSTYRAIEGLLQTVPAGISDGRFADHLAQQVVEVLSAEFACVGAQVFERRRSGWRLRSSWGEASPAAMVTPPAPSGTSQEDFPWIAPGHGAFLVGDGVIVLRFAGETTPELERDRMALLAALQLGTAYHSRRRELEDQLEQARAIQTSLLPDSPPAFFDYEIATASVPAQSVGGDAFDFLALSSEVLGIAVLDSAGHGLPAALQARDAITGVRMGVTRDLKASSLVERLNSVIYQSGLSSRFVSLVLAELERGGGLEYVNAGHPPPILLGEGRVEELTVGGTVLGPWPDTKYRVGFAHLDRGGSLVLYTDGVLEHGTARGDPFGVARLRQWVDDWRGGPAAEAVKDLLARLRSVGGPEPFEDDVTVVLVRRPLVSG